MASKKPRKRKAADEPYVVIAFDPGERTGYVTVRVDGSFNPFVEEHRDEGAFAICRQGVLTVLDAMDHLHDLIDEADVTVYETWRLYASHAEVFIGNDMQPSQVVGMIRYVARNLGCKTVSQGATVKKPAVALMPEWLKAHMALSSEQHDQDAIMHAWYYAVNRYQKEHQ